MMHAIVVKTKYKNKNAIVDIIYFILYSNYRCAVTAYKNCELTNHIATLD